jgi:hypothetical protein
MPETFTFIKGWENFYVIAGSSASGLTGLTFVVIALASDANMVRLSGLRTFITPIVIHFGSVLWIASVLSIPGHTALSLAITLGVTGITLTSYSAVTIARMVTVMRTTYKPAAEDWIWNATLPLACCLALLATSALMFSHAITALYIVGIVTLAMLFIGIHNAWDLAVWITAERPSKQQEHATKDAAATEESKKQS